MSKALISLSGGMDSATVLWKAIAEGREVECIGFYYGSKHGAFEVAAARKIAVYSSVKYHLVDLSKSDFVGGLKSNLLISGGDIPEGHYEEKSMEQTVVPGRNMIFISILSGLAWSRGCEEVWLGIHSGDHLIYPDCRPEFFYSMNAAVCTGTGGRVRLQAPFLYENKKKILEVGYSLGVPYHLTRTCYKNQPIACGKCGSCQERLSAHEELGIPDPLDYDTREILPKQGS